MFKKTWSWLVVTFVLVWFVQNSFLFFANYQHDDADGEFSSFVYKGPFSYCDVLTYAGQIRYSSESPSLLRSDALIKENSGMLFADGNIINVYSGWVLRWVGDVDWTPIVGSILPLLLSVFLLFKITKNILQDGYRNYIAFSLSIIVLLSNFDDFFGVWKFISGYFLDLPQADDIIPVGYNQRFPYGQFSNFIFIYWIHTIIKWWNNPSFKNQMFLAFSLVLCHYTYFYYWSYALPITLGVVIFKLPNWKGFVGLASLYLIGTIHYWDNFLSFNTSEFSVEYLERVKGPQIYSYVGVIVIGVISGWSLIIKNRKVGLALFLIPLFAVLAFKKTVFLFEIGSFYHLLITAFVFVILIAALIFGFIKLQLSKLELINLFNYNLMVVLNALVYVIGYNVQPYHWIFTTYYILLSICLVLTISPLLSRYNLKKVVIGFSLFIVGIGVLNSFRFAERNEPFWNLNADDVEVIDFIEKLPNKPVIGGNNIMPLITFSAHADLFLYTGSTSHSRSSYHELYYRFIDTYKRLKYSDSEILLEYEKYKGHKEYWSIYNSNDTSKRRALGQEWPNNLTLAAEALHHYFLEFDTKIEQLRKELINYNPREYNFELDYLVLHKESLIQKELVGIPVLENSSFVIYKLN